MNALEWIVAVAVVVYVPVEISIPFLVYRSTKNWDIVHDKWLMRKNSYDIGKVSYLPQYLEKLLKIANWLKLVTISSGALLVLYRLLLLK